MKRICEMTVSEIKEAYQNKELTVPEVIKAFMEEIKAKDNAIKAYITVCEDEAMKKAEEIQEKMEKGEQLGILAGIPIAIKDNICTKGIKTTCASKMLENFIPPYDATVIRKLENAGAIIIGKTNMDEFAMGGSTENSAFFATKNPVNLQKVPGGSSGGSAAAVCGNMAPVSLGSDTGGSIREPASFCGIIGMKPTYGLVSRYGLVAFASSLDQIGPFSKTVKDNAILLSAIAGHDEMDTTSADIATQNYTDALINNVKGLKIGIPKEYFGEGLNEEVRQALEKAINTYKELGAEVSECSLPTTQYALPAYYVIACAEASSNLGRFDGIRYGYRTDKFEDLKDIYRNSRSEGFGEEVKRRILLGTYVLSSGYYDAYYKKAQKVRTVIRDAYNKLFEKYDLLLTPTAPTTAFKIGEKIDDPIEMYLADIYTVPVNIAGLPGMSVPCKLDTNGLPISFQLITKAFGEENIFRAAYTYEQNTRFKENKPTFKGGTN